MATYWDIDSTAKIQLYSNIKVITKPVFKIKHVLFYFPRGKYICVI